MSWEGRVVYARNEQWLVTGTEETQALKAMALVDGRGSVLDPRYVVPVEVSEEQLEELTKAWSPEARAASAAARAAHKKPAAEGGAGGGSRTLEDEAMSGILGKASDAKYSDNEYMVSVHDTPGGGMMRGGPGERIVKVRVYDDGSGESGTSYYGMRNGQVRHITDEGDVRGDPVGPRLAKPESVSIFSNAVLAQRRGWVSDWKRRAKAR